MNFFVGLCNVNHCWPFKRSMVSVNRLRKRRSKFLVNDWILDSGAFTELNNFGKYRHDPEEYSEEVNRWSSNGNLIAASTQDFMCEPFILDKTGKTVEEHQYLTIERFVKIRDAVKSTYVLPVLQGYDVREYAEHVKQYGNLLRHGAWVGVGSVCKRNSSPDTVEDILLAIKSVRPDLRLHGFGLKIEALKNQSVRTLLDSSDSMAWSFNGRRNPEEGINPAHDPRVALRYCAKVEEALKESQFIQPILFDWWK